MTSNLLEIFDELNKCYTEGWQYNDRMQKFWISDSIAEFRGVLRNLASKGKGYYRLVYIENPNHPVFMICDASEGIHGEMADWALKNGYITENDKYNYYLNLFIEIPNAGTGYSINDAQFDDDYYQYLCNPNGYMKELPKNKVLNQQEFCDAMNVIWGSRPDIIKCDGFDITNGRKYLSKGSTEAFKQSLFGRILGDLFVAIS